MTGGGGRLAEMLRVLASCGHELDADQVLDVLWLARRLPGGLDAPLRPIQTGLRRPSSGSLSAPEPEFVGPRPSVPEPDDPELPDLTAPSLYAAARQGAVSEVWHRATGQEPRRAMPVAVPEDKSLSDELSLGRALRPLRRRIDSRHRTEVDEVRTATEFAETRLFAETGLADVVERPVRERWLRLVLLVDDGMSMLLWHRLAAELRGLLERLGAFATTRVLGLDAHDSRRPHLHARPFRPDSTKLGLNTVIDRSGRTLLLVVSDGMGAAWRSGAVHELLAERAADGPVAVLHTLPPEMWESSGISSERWQVTTRRIGGANASWDIIDPVLPPGLSEFEGLPVPVLGATAEALRPWANLLASPGATVELPLLAHPSTHGSVTNAADPSSVRHFRNAATPEAYRLAAHMAAVSPLSVPVMRLVQRSVPWTARVSHLAEVFLGGLLQPHPAPVPGPLPAKHRIFDFSEEAKTVLLDAVPQSELLETSGRIGRRLSQLAGNAPDFPAWLAHPEGSAQLPGSHQPFTHVERRLLSRLGVSLRGPSHPIALRTDTAGTNTSGWQPLTADDPQRIGGYELLGRRPGHRTLVYRGRNEAGTEAVLRIPRPELPAANARLIEVEAEVLSRLHGQYAPQLLATGLEDSPPWLAMTPITDADARDAQPLRLGEIFSQALLDGAALFDTIRGLLVSCYLANALALCHLNGIVPVDLSADSVFVLRRTVILGGLSDCVVDGEHHGPGAAPTRQDNVRSLGELLQLISTKAGWNAPNLPEGMHLWQGDTWKRLRHLVLRCLDPDPERRPTASEVAEVLAHYVSQTRLQHGRDSAGPAVATAREGPPTRVPLTRLPAAGTSQSGTRGLRLPRFGSARQAAKASLARLRMPLGHSKRVTVVSSHFYSGRSTTTMVLGSLLAAGRDEPVLALDGVAIRGKLHTFLNAPAGTASLRDLAALPLGASYAEISALTTHLPSGLQVVAHRRGRAGPNPAHAREYARVLEHTAPYYSVVLTDVSYTEYGDASRMVDDVILDHTDLLIICRDTAVGTRDDAARTVSEVAAAGHERLAREAIVVATELQRRPARRRPTARFDQQTEAIPHRTVTVPFDPALGSPNWKLNQLRPATVQAFFELAALVLTANGTGAGDDSSAGPAGG